MKIAFYSSKKYDGASFTKFKDLAPNFELTFLEARLDETTVALATGHDAVCVFVNDDVNAAVLDKLKEQGVKRVALRCAGFNNVDLKKASELGIEVVRVPAYSPEAVAEFAVGMILNLVRKYHKAYNRVREGNFLLDGLVGFNLSGKTVGLIGTGKIGLLAGRILSKGFQCRVIAYDPYPNPSGAQAHGISYVDDLPTLLKQSDIVSLHCPLSDSTKYIINEESLAQMKPGVVLVNTSRGLLIDTKALIKALKEGKIGAVGLDVYEKEGEYFFWR